MHSDSLCCTWQDKLPYVAHGNHCFIQSANLRKVRNFRQNLLGLINFKSPCMVTGILQWIVHFKATVGIPLYVIA